MAVGYFYPSAVEPCSLSYITDGLELPDCQGHPIKTGIFIICLDPWQISNFFGPLVDIRGDLIDQFVWG